MFMVSNSKLNLYTYLAQGNLYKNSNAIEQAFFFFCKAYTVHIFLSKLNILTQQELLFMPLKENILFGSQIFFCCVFKISFCFESHQQNKKDLLISEESFLLANTYTASAGGITARYTDPI